MATLLKSDLSPPQGMSEAEWKVRVDLAALYRLVALYGWDDLIFTHISARVPGPDQHFLINPYGMMFEEVTASSLVKVDIAGNIIGESDYGINYAGYVIHSAIHAARDDAHFVVHLHSPDGVAVASQAEGMLPLNQRSLAIIPQLSYHDYEGIALNLSEQGRLIADLGGNRLMILRNHGTLAFGSTAGEAWGGIYLLECACTAQVRALSAGRDNVLIAPRAAQEEVIQQLQQQRNAVEGTRPLFDLVWDASLRKAYRHSPGFDA
jgi:ribulose-5-phosphate 4-epimerase/fuculose-1-phosphate aldolase